MITQLNGRWAALSNFHLERDGTTVEHRFQAAKTLDPVERERVLAAATPGKAKYAGRRVTLRPDWEDVKVEVMRTELRRKFSDPELAILLLSTGDEEIQEGNTWNDTFWGISLRTGRGLNILGHLLMDVRAELAEALS